MARMGNPRILFFDTETTGVPKNYNAPITDLENWNRPIQIAWLVHEGSREVKRACYVLKPVGFEIPQDAASVHGITTAKALERGVDARAALREFADDAATCDFVVGHNVAFDINIVGAEMIRHAIPNPLIGKPYVCTMRKGTVVCKLTGRFGYKYPKLAELYSYLFGREMREAHDALADIASTSECYYEMERRGAL